MKVQAYIYNGTQEQKELVNKMIDVVDPDERDIQDIRYFNPKEGKEDILFAFGIKVQRQIEALNISCRIKIDLPELYELDPITGDEHQRELVYRQLLKIKTPIQEEVKQSNKIDIKDLPEHLTTKNLEDLERQIKDKNQESWQGVTKNGKTIKISILPTNQVADISLTFSELYAVLALREAFRVEELEIVPSKSTTHKTDTK